MEAENEVFELCEQVYEATGWRDTGRVFYSNGGKPIKDVVYWSDTVFDKPGNIPYYSSDYLLEKLSAVTDYVSVKRSNKISIDASDDEKSNWYAHYWLKSRRVQVKSSTPLKALLKLTLKLHEEGSL